MALRLQAELMLAHKVVSPHQAVGNLNSPKAILTAY